jgi:hypothetical protein
MMVFREVREVIGEGGRLLVIWRLGGKRSVKTKEVEVRREASDS